MKKIFGITLFLCFLLTSKSQTITSAQSGSWFNSSTWIGGVVPGSANDVIINAGHTITVPFGSGSATIKSLTVNSTGTFDDNFISGFNVLGDVNNNGTITNGSIAGFFMANLFNNGALTRTGSTTLVLGGRQLVNNGSLETSQLILTGDTMTISGSGTFLFGAGGISIVTGTLPNGSVANRSVFLETPLTVPIMLLSSIGSCKVFLNDKDFRADSVRNSSGTSYFVINSTGRLIISNNHSTKLLPIGTMDSYTPVIISGGNTTSHNFAARVSSSFQVPPAGGAYVNRQWVVEDVTGGANVDINFQWNGSDENSGFNRTSSAVARFTNPDWQAITPYSAATGTDPYNSVATTVSTFGSFTIANSNAFRIMSAQSGNWSSPATWMGGIVPATSDNAGISPGHTVTYDLPTTTITSILVNSTANLQLNPNNILVTGKEVFNNGTITLSTSANLRIGGDLTNSATIEPGAAALNTILSVTRDISNTGVLSAQSLYLSANDLGLNTNAQSITSNNVLDGFNTTILKNDGVPVTLNCSANFDVLDFNGTTGNLVVKDSTLTVTGNITGFNSSRYIQTNGIGRLRLNGPASSKVFPVGTSTSYTPLTINNGNTSTETFSVRVKDTLTNPSFIGAIVKREWDISNPTGGANVDLTFQWNAGDETPSFDRSVSYVGHYTGGAWTHITAPFPAIGSGPYSKTATGVNSFSPFAIGSNGALPLRWLYFKAAPCDKEICLQWATDNEVNSDEFLIERSQNGGAYETIGHVKAANTNATTIYSYSDASPAKTVLYYRIRQKDLDGRYSYSAVVRIDNRGRQIVTLSPNPSNGMILIKGSSTFDYIELTDITGRFVKRLSVKADDKYDISSLSEGIYLLKLVSAVQHNITLKLIKQ